ncbi:MAG TPA: GAF domain-containing protein, partial [Nodosilinea sp.]|nr:GAF domain-containing protein [Nodosilinea sp.]
MPDFLDRGIEQVIPGAALVLLGQFLRQYCQQHQITLLTDTDLPTPPPGETTVWCLLGADLSLVVAACPQAAPEPNAPDQPGIPPVLVRLLTEAPAVDDYLGHLGLGPRPLAPTSPAALAQFMLAWVQVCAQANQAEALGYTLGSTHTPISRRQERRLLLNQVITKIQGSLELAEILETTVAEVRQFLQADRLLIYQFEPAPAPL